MKCKYKYKYGSNKGKQCPYKAKPDSKFCIWHQEINEKDFHGKKIKEKNLQESYLVDAKLQGAEFKGKSNLSFSNLQGANLSNANLQGANLFFANLQGANLSNANLQGANLFFANLQGANLSKTILRNADLRFAELQGARLRLAKLRGADLRQAKLQGANLQYAELQESNLWCANLQGALFWGTELWGANLKEAKVLGAILYKTEIKETRKFKCDVILNAQNNKEVTQEVLGDIIKEKKQIVNINIEDLVNFKPDILDVKINLRKELLVSELIHFFYGLDLGRKRINIDSGGIVHLSKKCYDIIDSEGSPDDKADKIGNQVKQFVEDHAVYKGKEEKIKTFIVEDIQRKLQANGFLDEKFEKIKRLVEKNYREFLNEVRIRNGDYLALVDASYISARDVYSDLKTCCKEHGYYDDSGKYFIAEFKIKGKIYSIQSRIAFYKICEISRLFFQKIVFLGKKKSIKDSNKTREKFSSILGSLCKNCLHSLINKFLYIISDYGESPGKVVWASSLIIFASGLLYWVSKGVAVTVYGDPVNGLFGLLNCLYFSAVTFTTLGYGDFRPMPYMRWAAGIEAFIGAFSIAYFVVVVGRKIMR